MISKFKIRLFSMFSIILLCIGVTIKELQNDTFYIIKLGEHILNYGVDLVDHYSWVANLSYTYPHWLYDVFMYVIYINFNFFGVYVSTIILYIILIFSIYLINLRINKNELMATIVAIVSIPCLIGFVTARAQLVTAILFLWQVYFIEKLIYSGKKQYILFLILISLLVANMHATIWPFYFILYLPFIGQQLIYKISKWKKLNINNKLIINEVNNFNLLIAGFVFSFLIGFLSPSKICFTYIFKIMLGNSQDFIVEHAPMVLINNISFFIFILVMLVILIFSDTKIKLKELFMIGGLIFMSLCSFRHVVFFYIIGLLYASILCNRYLKEKGDKTLEILYHLFVNNKFIYLFCFILIICVSCYKFNKNFSDDYISKKAYPVDAVNFIKNNLDIEKIRLYNDYNFGSYLLFHDIPVFVDSRCDLYLKEFNGLKYSIFDDAINIVYDYEEKFEFYDVTHVLISTNTVFYKVISKDDDYIVLYEDKNFILFERLNYEKFEN